jgi:hypothetical protein
MAGTFNKGQRHADAGMTDDQRTAAQSASRAEFDTRYMAWVASLDPNTIPYASLPHQQLLGLFDAGQPSLGLAKAHADLALSGRVVSLRLTPFDGTYVTMDVESWIKSPDRPSTIEFHQLGGVRPTADWKGMFIADGPNAPLLLPGSRATLLLQTGATGGAPEVQSFTGIYLHVDGVIRTVSGNPFGPSVDGLTEAAFAEQIAVA